MDRYDVIIVGGGAMGLSSAYYAAKSGKKVLVLEKYPFFNQRGSSGDFMRMWRVMYSEEYNARLALQTDPLWKELEEDLGQELITRSGLLFFGEDTGATSEGSIGTAIEVMKKLGIPYTEMTSAEMQEKYPFTDLPDNNRAVYQENAGAIHVKAVLRGLYEGAAKHGAELHENEEVVELTSHEHGVTVKTDKDTYHAHKLIICAGVYANSVLQPFGFQLALSVWEMNYAYYQVTDPKTAEAPMWFQFKPDVQDLFYGFPPADWAVPGFVRVALDYTSRTYDSPSQRSFIPGPEINLTSNFVASHMRGVDAAPVAMGTCLYANLPDNEMLLDFAPSFVPHHKNIVIHTAGWSFKFTPMIGKICTELAFEGKTEYDISHFSINRPQVLIPKTKQEA